MSLMDNAKMPSLRDKIEAAAGVAESKAEKAVVKKVKVGKDSKKVAKKK